MDKVTMRREAAARRAILKDGLRDEEIAARVLNSGLMRFGSFFVYVAFRTEVATERVIRELLRRDKRVCVPRIENGRMAAVPYGPLSAGPYGILSPEGGEDTPCEVALCPLLAFDKEGFRLGYGGGYYDRYLGERPHVLRVGLAYAGQAVEALPHAPHDAPLDCVVTENGILSFSKKSVWLDSAL